MQAGSTSMSPALRAVFGFVAVNALAGAGSLLLFPTYTDTLFFWEIAPALSATLFGALYLGGALTVAWVTYQGAWEPARFLIPVLVSAGVAISITTLLHLDRFDPGFKLLYWLLIYVGAPILAIGFYIDQERKGASWAVTQPVAPIIRLIAVALGGLLVALGIILVIWPAPAVAYWPWPMTPLMLRVFASWFGAFGVGLLWFQIEREWTRVVHVANLMIAAAAFDLLMLLVHRSSLTTTGPALWLYCLHLALLGGLGFLMHFLQRAWVARGIATQPGMS